MNKILHGMLICCMSLSSTAKATEVYAVIGYGVEASMVGCENVKLARVVSEPVLLPFRNQSVKWSLIYQFVNWASMAKKDDLDLVAGKTKIQHAHIIYGNTAAEAQSKAKRYGLYASKTSTCSLTGNNHFTVNVLEGFSFEKGTYDELGFTDKKRKDLEMYMNGE